MYLHYVPVYVCTNVAVCCRPTFNDMVRCVCVYVMSMCLSDVFLEDTRLFTIYIHMFGVRVRVPEREREHVTPKTKRHILHNHVGIPIKVHDDMQTGTWFLSMIGDMTPPVVSMPRVSGVTSIRTISFVCMHVLACLSIQETCM